MSKPDDFKKATTNTWDANPAGWSHAPDAPLGSKAFFEQARAARRDIEIPFIKELIPWQQFQKVRVLEVGCGAGFDAFEFCEHGADYTGIDYASRNPARARAHLEHFGHHPPLLRSDGERLPFTDASFDVVFSNGVLHHTPDMPCAFHEAHRVLKLGGSFWVILYHKQSAHYWGTIVLWDYLLRGGFLKRSLAQQRSRIEQTGVDEGVLVNVYSRKEFKSILQAAGFEVRMMWVRKLPGRDLPGYRLLKHIYPLVPRAIARWFERRFGWYVIAHAEKRDA